MLNKERENVVAPDTTGVDFFFLMDFITDDMSSDFAFIEQDFLKNCRGRLDEFQNVGWYGERSFRTSRPRYAMQNNVLRLIYNGAKIGDDYCLELIKNLYKVYHKKEYKQLKRFSKINPDEIFSLSEDEYEDSDHCSIGRIMGMCQFMGIELHENCSFMYKLLNNKREDYLAEIAELRKKLNEKEQENKYLREQYRNARNSAEVTEGLVKKYEAERDELIALREYAYNSEHEDDVVEEDKLPDMEKAIADKKIVIIGGHVNWQNKFKQIFPEWFFVHPDAYKTVNAGMLEGKEKVYFFTDYINHISYKKFIAIVRERNIPFGYIGSRNINSVVYLKGNRQKNDTYEL